MTEDVSLKIPHSTLNEQLLIAAALSDNVHADLLISKLQPDLFVDKDHGVIWTAIVEARRRKLEPDASTLSQLSGGAIDISYIATLKQEHAVVPSNIEHHVGALRWDSAKADMVSGPLSDFLLALKKRTTSQQQLQGLASAIKASLDVHVDRKFMRDPVLLAQTQANEITARSKLAVYPYGIEGLDKYKDGTWRLIPGTAPKRVTVITGVSGSCKSVMAAKIALAQVKMKRRVLYGAWEMDDGPTLELMAMMSLGMDRYSLSTGAVSDLDVAKLRKRMEQIGSYVRFFAPPKFARGKPASNDAALDTIERQVADSGAEVCIFDLWERGQPDNSPGAERQALFRQQAIAKDTNTHHILVSQQKLKAVESTEDKRPRRDTIFGSQAWVDIADTILGIHRPALWKNVPDDVLEVDILKQRYGKWPLTVSFGWDGDTCKLSNPEAVDYVVATRKASGFLGS